MTDIVYTKWGLANRFYDPDTIELRRYSAVNKVWFSLPTKLVSKDKEYYYFEAETPGFSIFAIVGKKIEKRIYKSEEDVCYTLSFMYTYSP